MPLLNISVVSNANFAPNMQSKEENLAFSICNMELTSSLVVICLFVLSRL